MQSVVEIGEVSNTARDLEARATQLETSGGRKDKMLKNRLSFFYFCFFIS